MKIIEPYIPMMYHAQNIKIKKLRMYLFHFELFAETISFLK